jgi:hypothetical protein
MAVWRQFALFVVAFGLLFGTACQKKKLPIPAKAQTAPTLAVSVPDQIPELEVPPEPPVQQQEATVEEPVPKKTQAKHKNTKKTAQAAVGNQTNPAATTSTVAVNRPPANPGGEASPGGAPDPAIAADVSHQQLVHQKQSTSELLDSTEKDLKGLNRGLSHDEETMVAQIRSYIAQSRKATSDGDFERAYNLAVKAHLLSDALVKK